jgi:hypothetical protein
MSLGGVLRGLFLPTLAASLLAGCGGPASAPSGDAGPADASAAWTDGSAAVSDAAVAGNGRVAPFPLVHGETKEIDLGPLSSSVAGCKVRFTVELTGNPATLAKLTNITLVGSATTGVHLRSPSFAIYDPADLAQPVAVNTDYAGAEVVITANDSGAFYPSLLLLTDYRAGRLLDFGAALAEPFNGSLDLKPNDPSIQCKNVPGFTALKPLLLGMGSNLNCHNCHFAGVGGFSTFGFDNPALDAQSCVGTLLASNVNAPAMTSYYIAVTGGGHGAGQLNAASSQAMLTALTTWLDAEQ